MAASDNWRELAPEFRGVAASMGTNFHWGAWTAFGAAESHGYVCGWKLSESSTFRARFTPVAMRAARLLDPSAGNLLIRWLEALRIELPGSLGRRDLIITITHGKDGDSIQMPATEYSNLAIASADLCNIFEARAYEIECRPEVENPVPSAQMPSLIQQVRLSPKELKEAYITAFPDIVILDICWAAKQRHHEWTRWLGGKLKDGYKPDRAFRALLTSGQRPQEYRPEPRPKGWK